MLSLTSTWSPFGASEEPVTRPLGDREGLHWLAEHLPFCEVADLRPDSIVLRVAVPDRGGLQIYRLTDNYDRLYGLVRIIQTYLAIQDSCGDVYAKAVLAQLRLSGTKPNIYNTPSWVGEPDLSYPAIILPQNDDWRDWYMYRPLRAAVVLGLVGNAPGYLMIHDNQLTPLIDFLDRVLNASHEDPDWSHPRRPSAR